MTHNLIFIGNISKCCTLHSDYRGFRSVFPIWSLQICSRFKRTHKQVHEENKYEYSPQQMKCGLWMKKTLYLLKTWVESSYFQLKFSPPKKSISLNFPNWPRICATYLQYHNKSPQKVSAPKGIHATPCWTLCIGISNNWPGCPGDHVLYAKRKNSKFNHNEVLTQLFNSLSLAKQFIRAPQSLRHTQRHAHMSK